MVWSLKLLSVDPGKHNGWATWEYDSGSPHLLTMGVTETLEDFYDLLATQGWQDFDQVVYEDYIIRPRELNKQWGHEWNSGVALRAIGAIEFFARQHAVQIAKQPASVLPVGCGYIGYSYRKGVHVPNNISAIAHGAYWLVKNKHATSRGFKVLAS